MAVMVPLALSPPSTLFTCQVTAVFEALRTVAVNCAVAVISAFEVVGEMLIHTLRSHLHERA